MTDETYTHPTNNEPLVILSNIQKYLIKLYKNHSHLTICTSKIDTWKNFPKESGMLLNSLYETFKTPPYNTCSIIFFANSYSLLQYNSEFYNALKVPISDSTFYYNAFTEEETKYSFERMNAVLNLSLIHI